MKLSNETIRALPKSDVHIHLDGSLRVGTLIDLARSRGVTLPSYTVEGLRELVFKSRYANLQEYLQGFAYTCAVLRDEEAIERCSFELCEDAIAEGVRYQEIRFAPQLLASKGGEECIGALRAVARGCERAAKAHAISKQPDDLEFKWGIICCSMRSLAQGMSPYFDALLELLPSFQRKDIARIASIEAARTAIAARDLHGVPVVGVDLAGAEDGFRAKYHESSYHEAHERFLFKTVHAGEAYGPESIYEAITTCHADRIGHGTFLFSPDRIKDLAIKDRQGYVNDLVEYIAAKRITLEVCPTSNLQTLPELEGDILKHPLAKMLRANLSVTIATDNRLVSDVTLCSEMALVLNALDLDSEQIKRLVLGGFKAAFFAEGYSAKRHFVKQAGDRIEAILKQAGAEG